MTTTNQLSESATKKIISRFLSLHHSAMPSAVIDRPTEEINDAWELIRDYMDDQYYWGRQVVTLNADVADWENITIVLR